MEREIFVQNIKRGCERKGIKPTVACRESGVGPSFINDFNRGQTPSVAKVQILATYLGVTTSELLGEVPMGTYSRMVNSISDDGPSDKEQTWLCSFRQLNCDGQDRAVEYLHDLLASGRYSSDVGGERR